MVFSLQLYENDENSIQVTQMNLPTQVNTNMLLMIFTLNINILYMYILCINMLCEC